MLFCYWTPNFDLFDHGRRPKTHINQLPDWTVVADFEQKTAADRARAKYVEEQAQEARIWEQDRVRRLEVARDKKYAVDRKEQRTLR